MNSLGGDNFWLINTVDQKLIGIEATGFSSEKATIDFYKSKASEGIISFISINGNQSVDEVFSEIKSYL